MWTVLLDFENVNVASNTCGAKFVDRITLLLQLLVPGSTVRIVAVGNIVQIAGEVSDGRPLIYNQLRARGVSIHHVPSRKPESADKVLLVEFALALRQNPAKSGIAFCSGDFDFNLAMTTASSKGFRTALFHPSPDLNVLGNAADDVFSWRRDVLSFCEKDRKARSSVPEKAAQHPQPTTNAVQSKEDFSGAKAEGKTDLAAPSLIQKQASVVKASDASKNSASNSKLATESMSSTPPSVAIFQGTSDASASRLPAAMLCGDDGSEFNFKSIVNYLAATRREDLSVQFVGSNSDLNICDSQTRGEGLSCCRSLCENKWWKKYPL